MGGGLVTSTIPPALPRFRDRSLVDEEDDNDPSAMAGTVAAGGAGRRLAALRVKNTDLGAI